MVYLGHGFVICHYTCVVRFACPSVEELRHLLLYSFRINVANHCKLYLRRSIELLVEVFYVLQLDRFQIGNLLINCINVTNISFRVRMQMALGA